MTKLKLKDAVTTDKRRGYGYVGDIQAFHEPNAIHPDGLALVRKMGTQRKRWHRISELVPLDGLNK